MSCLLDSLCGAERLTEIAKNERAMKIAVHESPSFEVIEERDEAVGLAMEACEVGE